MNFHPRMVEWVMCCVTTPTYSIYLNGCLEGFFPSAKGLRQGDPISPYLFILIMEAFSAMLDRQVMQPGFVFHPKCGDLKISNVIFADDLFILCGADNRSLCLVKSVIDGFGNASGLRPNLLKSSMFISGVSADEQAVLSNYMGMEIKELPVKYLGVPLISTRLKVRDCESIKSRILARIQSWTSKTLSYAGRLQLAVSVLQGIQNYWSSIFVLPKKILKDIDDTIKWFIWSGTELKKTGARVVWKDICCPTKEGGLGIRSAVDVNKAAMLKHLWDIARKKDSLWVKWCHMFMLRGKSVWGCRCFADSSWTWRKILKLRSAAIQFIRYVVGDGSSVYVWHDNWHPLGPLKTRFGARIIYDASSTEWAVMADYVDTTGWIKPNVVSPGLIAVVNNWPNYVPDMGMKDNVEWVLTHDKKYSLRSAWNGIRIAGNIVDWYHIVWYKDAIPRCSFILWLVCKDRMRTRDRLKRWGVVEDSSCVLCGEEEENRDHLFFGCAYASNVWRRVLHRNQQGYNCVNWQEELNEAIHRFRGSSLAARLGRLTMAVTMYCIWEERNARIFQHICRTEDAIMASIQGYVVGRCWNWKTKRTYENWLLCKEWGIRECIML